MFSLKGQILQSIVSASTTSGAITPSDIPNLIEWMRSKTGTVCSGTCTNNDLLASWTDQSASANNLIPGTCFGSGGPIYHTNRINGKPGITFNGSAQCLEFITGYSFGTAETVFVVMANASTGAAGTVYGGHSGAFGWWTCKGSGTKEQGVDIVGVLQVGTGNAACDTSWHQMNVTYNLTTLAFRLDRTSDGGATQVATVTSNQISVGNQDGGQYFNGDIAELIVYSRVLSGTEIGQIETYLNGEYGI